MPDLYLPGGRTQKRTGRRTAVQEVHAAGWPAGMGSKAKCAD